MMAAPSFAAHPGGGIPGHAPMPHGGHPMVSGHPSNQGVPGGGQLNVSMGQQMHAGMVGGPGAPQVSQAGPMMSGMPQGGGAPGGSGPTPSAHALSHLNPAQPQFITPQHHIQQASKLIFPIISSKMSLVFRLFR